MDGHDVLIPCLPNLAVLPHLWTNALNLERKIKLFGKNVTGTKKHDKKFKLK